MIIHKCDRCGVEIEEEEEKSIGERLVEAMNQVAEILSGKQKTHDLVLYDVKRDPRKIDLCAECKENLYAWFVKEEQKKGSKECTSVDELDKMPMISKKHKGDAENG